MDRFLHKQYDMLYTNSFLLFFIFYNLTIFPIGILKLEIECSHNL